LFKDLDRLDFLKCDIEGYEEFVFPEMKSVFEKHQPIIQVETWGTHKKVVEDFLFSLGYQQYHLQQNKLQPTTVGHDPNIVDFIFVHPHNLNAMERIKMLG
jgi:hypothetical protein